MSLRIFSLDLEAGESLTDTTIDFVKNLQAYFDEPDKQTAKSKPQSESKADRTVKIKTIVYLLRKINK